MIKIELSFNTLLEAQAALDALQAASTTKTSTPEAPGKPMTATEVKANARGPRTAAVATAPAAPAASGKPSEPKAEDTPKGAAANSAPAAEAPTEETVSREIRKFIPNPEHKAQAVALLKKFGVSAGRDLKPDQRAPFLAELAKLATECGL